MPNEKNMVCVKKGKTTYCWNFDTCRLEIYTKKIIAVNDCPKDIMNMLMELINERANESGENQP